MNASDVTIPNKAMGLPSNLSDVIFVAFMCELGRVRAQLGLGFYESMTRSRSRDTDVGHNINILLLLVGMIQKL